MRVLDIRARLLLSAIAPVIVLSLVLATIFLGGRVGDVGDSHQQRNRQLARQLATAAEYGLFSLNTEQLQSLVDRALREPDVVAATLLDPQGRVVARAAADPSQAYRALGALNAAEALEFDAARGLDRLLQPIRSQPIKIDEGEGFEARAAGLAPAPQGYLLLEISRQSLRAREATMLITGIGVALLGLMAGIGLALRLARGVIAPILRISRMVERLQGGDFSRRTEVVPSDPLLDLQHGLNELAERLALRQEELQARVDEVTRELRLSKEEAEAATLAKSRFLAAASHDLRQPTHALGLFVARLGQLPQDAQSRHLIGKLDASVQAVQDLLDALLDVSRLEAQTVELRLQPIGVVELFARIESTLAASAQAKGVRLRVRSRPVWVMSDLPLLQRILLNLVSNAIRYTMQGGVLLTSRYIEQGRLLRIEVWDTGIGIAPENRDVIFQEFFQVANPQRDRRQGLGLGLNIARRASQLLGHRLELTSVPGRGSRFWIELPLCMPPASPPAVALVPDLRAPVGRVLVIEDDALALDGLLGLLESWGLAVSAAGSSSKALALLERLGPPDVILSDYRLPEGQNGIETIRALRAQAQREIPACLISGDIDPAVLQSARDAGLTLLHKPVRPAKLRSLIRHLMPQAAAEPAAITPIQAADSEPR